MNKCNYCNNENVDMNSISIEIAGENIDCLQCSVCKSVILKTEDINAINERYCDVVEQNEDLQNELDSINRVPNGPNVDTTDEDVTEYINFKNEPSFYSPK